MKVKCPKCRLRYDVPTPKGITEVQCYCPRCGTPFTYSINNEEVDWDEELKQHAVDNEVEDNTVSVEDNAVSTEQKEVIAEDDKKDNSVEKQQGSDTEPKKPSIEPKKPENERKEQTEEQVQASELQVTQASEQQIANDSETKEETSSSNHPNDSTVRELYQKRMLAVRDPLSVLERHTHHSKRRVYMFILGIMAMIVFVGLFAKGVDMVIGHFADNDEAISEKLAIDSTLSKKDSTKVAENNKKEKKEKRGKNKKHEAEPQWLQGEWHLDYNKGYILMYIKGNKITVTDGHHTNKGTIHCKGNKMICKYSDGRTFDYNLDKKHHLILVQDGMAMKKVSGIMN